MRERPPHSKKQRSLASLMSVMILAAGQAIASDGEAVRLAGLLAVMILATTQSNVSHGEEKSPLPAVTPSASGHAAARVRKASPYRPQSNPDSAQTYYQSVWGVDNLLVRQTASGNLIRFSYRVTDPERARQLGDKEATPYMVGVRSRVVLQVPSLEQVGPLRQTGVPQTGQKFWMVFSNKGNLVKVGDRVNVIIGSFHADGLLVE